LDENLSLRRALSYFAYKVCNLWPSSRV
jgi:hypothetical protein